MSELAEADTRDGELYQRVVESALRLGLLAMLGLWCFQIIQPFIGTTSQRDLFDAFAARTAAALG